MKEYASWHGSQWPSQMYVSAKFQELRDFRKVPGVAEVQSLPGQGYTVEVQSPRSSWVDTQVRGVMSTYVEVWAHSHRRRRRSEPAVTIDKCSKSTTTYRQGIYK
jgi:hypothetical protein